MPLSFNRVSEEAGFGVIARQNMQTATWRLEKKVLIMLNNTSADAPFTNINASLLRPHLVGTDPKFSGEDGAV